MKTSFLPSVALCALVLCAGLPLLAAGKSDVQAAVDAAAAALPGWTLDYVDSPAPKTDVGEGAKGYRVIFTRQYDLDSAQGVVGGKIRLNHMDMVLVPQAKGFNQLDAKTDILWSQAPEEYFTAPRWLGSALGFEWFCRSNIMTLDAFRGKMKLSGGETRLNVLCAGLTVSDPGFTSARYAAEQLKAFGKDAIPGVAQAVLSMQAEGLTPRAPMNALKLLNCPEADKALASYAASKDDKLKVAAWDALCVEPFVKSAKDAYLKMLESRRNVALAGEACRAFGAGAEAQPLLGKVVEAPLNLLEYKDALVILSEIRDGKRDEEPFQLAEAIAALSVRSGELPGTPQTFSLDETKEVRKARLEEAELKRLKPVEAKLAACASKELAFTAALWLCFFKSNAVAPDGKLKERDEANISAYSERVNASGLRVLQAMPREFVMPALSNLARKLASVEERKNVKRLCLKYAPYDDSFLNSISRGSGK